MSKPLISLVTCNFNSGHLLADTVHSVLNQTLVRHDPASIEYVVLDAGSRDGSLEAVLPLLERPFIRVIRKPDKGLYDGLANAFELTTAPLMSWINAGDLLFPTALEAVAAIHRDSGLKWLTGYNCFATPAGPINGVRLPFRYRTGFFECGIHGTRLEGVQQESTWWHRDLLEGFDWERFRTLKLAGDFFLWQFLARKTLPQIAHTTFGAFRRHHGQLSGDASAYRSELYSLCRPPRAAETALSLLDQVLWRLPNSWKRELARNFHVVYSNSKERWECLGTP